MMPKTRDFIINLCITSIISDHSDVIYHSYFHKVKHKAKCQAILGLESVKDCFCKCTCMLCSYYLLLHRALQGSGEDPQTLQDK